MRWVEAARPKTLIASVSPVLIGTKMASKLDITVFAAALLFALAIQIGTNFVNDFFDNDAPDRIGPRRMTASGLISKRDMKRAIVCAFGFAALTSLYLIWVGGMVIALLAALAIALGVWYTAGHYSLSQLGLGDPIVFFFFGPVATGGVAYLMSMQLEIPAILSGITPGALSTALLAVNNIRDREDDEKNGRRTIPVKFGRIGGVSEYILMLLLAATGAIFSPLAALTLVTGLPLIQTVATTHDMAALNPVLVKTGRLLTLYTLVFCLTV